MASRETARTEPQRSLSSNARRRRRTLTHNWSRSSGWLRTMSTAAATLATFDGDPDAVNTYARARKCSARSSA